MVFKVIFSYLVPEISVFKGPNFSLFCTFQMTSALCQHILNNFEWVQQKDLLKLYRKMVLFVGFRGSIQQI